MSFDYRGCFILGTEPIDSARMESALTSFGLTFAGAFSSLEYQAGRVQEKPAASRDWAAFIADGNGPTPSAFGQLEAEEFRFDFGFVLLPGWPGGTLPLGSAVRAGSIAPPAESAAAMRQSPWLREVDVNGVQVLARYLSGLEEYFPKTDA